MFARGDGLPRPIVLVYKGQIPSNFPLCLFVMLLEAIVVFVYCQLKVHKQATPFTLGYTPKPVEFIIDLLLPVANTTVS